MLVSLVPETTFARYAWQKQELLKGTSLTFGTTDGGWRFNMKPNEMSGANQPAFVVRYEAEEANTLITQAEGRATLKTEPVFSPTDEMLTPSADIVERQNELYKILAYRIPALSPAMGRIGANVSQMTSINVNALTDYEKWGRNNPPFNKRWLHSDIKDMAYFYISTLFAELRDRINQSNSEEE